jgi:hypothetical protein
MRIVILRCKQIQCNMPFLRELGLLTNVCPDGNKNK